MTAVLPDKLGLFEGLEPSEPSSSVSELAVGGTMGSSGQASGHRLAASDFPRLYAEHVDMVWRALRGLGVDESGIEDAVQDVFLVVHRRLDAFEGRSSFKTWLFGIALGVARNHRRRARRKQEAFESTTDVEDRAPTPDEEAATAQALRTLGRLLEALDESKREVFVLAELEQMSAPEIAETLGLNVNTVYSRLRAARRAFDAAVEKDTARASAPPKSRGGRP